MHENTTCTREHTCTYTHGTALTNAVLVDFNGSVVHLSHSLHLQVVAVAVVRTLAVDVLLKIFRHKLREIVSILQLQENMESLEPCTYSGTSE